METPQKSKKSGRKKLLAISLIALLAIGGIAAVSMVEAATPGASPSVTQGQINGEYLEVVVWAQVNGHRIAVQDANVTVYSISHTTDAGGNITITLTPVANAVTGSNGTAYFNLQNGNYVIIAGHDGARGVALLHLRFYTTKFVQLKAAPAQA